MSISSEPTCEGCPHGILVPVDRPNWHVHEVVCDRYPAWASRGHSEQHPIYRKDCPAWREPEPRQQTIEWEGWA